MYHHLPTLIKDKENVARISVVNSSFNELFEKCIHPIWSYGKNGEYIQKEMIRMIDQLKQANHKKRYSEIFYALKIKIKSRQDSSIA